VDRRTSHQRHRAWAETVVDVLETQWPWGSAHWSLGPDDCDVTPERLHPAFHGSVDWHSAVHMQWSGVRLLAEHGGEIGPVAGRLERLLDHRLTPENGAVEAAYLRARPSYERPYGWAWSAMLAATVREVDVAAGWCAATDPVAEVVGGHLLDWLPRLAHPVRHGVHSNTAFALALAHDAFGRLGREEVVAAISSRAREWFTDDRDYPARWEPGGEDFLSPALCETELMRRVLPEPEFTPWLADFLPGLGHPEDPLLTVPEVLDPADGKSAHLFGLALSRAWLLRSLSRHLPGERRVHALAAAERQVAAVEQEIVGGDLMATHWLVSFALLAEDAVLQAGG
jgi:hypothetical protein